MKDEPAPACHDPDADLPMPLTPEKRNKLWSQIVESWLSRLELTRETAYAMIKTGLAVTEENKHLLSAAELDEWTNAIEEARYQMYAAVTDEKLSPNPVR